MTKTATIANPNDDHNIILPASYQGYIFPRCAWKIAYMISRGYNCYIYGNKGSGKTELMHALLGALNKSYEMISCTEETSEFDLEGHFSVTDKSMIFKYGPLLRGLANNAVMVWDEIDRLTNRTRLALNSIMEGGGDRKITYTIKQTGERLQFPVTSNLATANTDGFNNNPLYEATRADSSTKDRMSYSFFLDRPDVSVTKEILARLRVPDNMIEAMIHVSDETYEMYNQGKLSDYISLRQLIAWGKAFVMSSAFDVWSKEHAFEHAVLYNFPKVDGVDSDRDEVVKIVTQRFSYRINGYVDPTVTVPVTSSVPKTYKYHAMRLPEYETFTTSTGELYKYYFPEVAHRVFTLIEKEGKERGVNIYLFGDKGSGKTDLAKCVLQFPKPKEFEFVNCSPETTEQDLEGSFVVVDGETKWVDGPVTRAVRFGRVLIFDEFDRLNNRCLHYLHPILEGGVGNTVQYTVKQTGERLKCKSLIIIATGNDDGYGNDPRFEANKADRASFERLSFKFKLDRPSNDLIVKILRDAGCEDSDITQMLDFADDTVKMFREGKLQDCISLRRLIAWGKGLVAMRETAHCDIGNFDHWTEADIFEAAILHSFPKIPGGVKSDRDIIAALAQAKLGIKLKGYTPDDAM